MSNRETINSLLTLISLDAKNLMIRIAQRKEEYVSEFSLKRTREHFKEIFFTRYSEAKMNDLKELSQDLIIVMDEFYTKAEQLNWYLNHTQDMANTVYDNVSNQIRILQKLYEKLDVYLRAELK